MNILFLHSNFPAQFKHVARYFARDDKNTVVFVSDTHAKQTIPNVRHYVLNPSEVVTKPSSANEVDQILAKSFTEKFAHSLNHANSLNRLKNRGFTPDLIYDHSGWGMSLFIKDIFPEAAYASYLEWFYTKGADYAYFASPDSPCRPSDFMGLRLKNLFQLNALAECDLGISPTAFQKSTYPEVFHQRIEVLHDGIDTDFFHPRKGEKFAIPGLDMSPAKEILTFTARGLEPYRGFPQFYQALPEILEARPDLHVVIMADDIVAYGPESQPRAGLGAAMRKQLPLDEDRVHFLPKQPFSIYRSLLQASTVHVYLTVPFVLSWSLLEAMACGCLIVASGTEPVLEVAEDGKNAILADLRDTRDIAQKIIFALKRRHELAHLREAARQTVLDGYALSALLPRHAAALTEIAAQKSRTGLHGLREKNM